MKIPKPIALVGFAYAAMATASLDVTEANTFFVGGFQDPTVVFRDGLQPGFETGLEDAANASAPKHALASPSHEAAVDMSFAQQESEAQLGFVYQVTLHGLPGGYWLHSANQEIADVLVLPGAIPSRNIQGVYIHQKDGSSGPAAKMEWIPNQNPSASRRPRKRQTKPCVPLDPDDPDPEVDGESDTSEGGEDEEDVDPRCFTRYHGSLKDRQRDRKTRKKAGTSWRRRNCL